MLSVMMIKLFKLSDDKVGTDKVEEAIKNFWSAMVFQIYLQTTTILILH